MRVLIIEDEYNLADVISLEDSDTTYSNIDLNGYKLYINGLELTK